MSATANRRRKHDRALVRAAKALAAHPPCYYCGRPVAKIVCWPAVCSACDDLPGWEAL